MMLIDWTGKRRSSGATASVLQVAAGPSKAGGVLKGRPEKAEGRVD